DAFQLSTDPAKLDLKVIHNYLSNESYWAKNIPFETVKSAVENSLNFGLYYQDRQIGYARIVSDYTSMAYLADVFILEAFRGQGLSKWLMETIMQHPNLQGLRRWILLTRDAHELYKRFGWQPIAIPDRWMEVHNPNVYLT
ncbi:MAG: GNAT family N-acetyltransferase, partial [Bacteroidota bacterium]